MSRHSAVDLTKSFTLRDGRRVVADKQGRPFHYANRTQATAGAQRLRFLGADVSVHQPRMGPAFYLAFTDARANPDEDPVFGEIISSYSRKQAVEDGDLVDVTEWASNTKGFIGGFTEPVAITRALWNDIDRKPMPHLQDVRGRAHDVLWMASLAVRAGIKRGMISDSKQGGRVCYDVLLQVGRKWKHRLCVDLGPGDDGRPVVTIGYPADF